MGRFSARPEEVAAVATKPDHAHRLRLRVFVKNTRGFFGHHVGPEKEDQDFFFYSARADAAGNGSGGTGFEVRLPSMRRIYRRACFIWCDTDSGAVESRAR